MNSSSVSRSINRIQRVQRRCGRRYPEAPLTWGFQLDSDTLPSSNGEAALRVTTLGGERLWLTPTLLHSLEDHFFYLSGNTPAVLHPPLPHHSPGTPTEGSAATPLSTFPMLLLPGSRELDAEDVIGLPSTYDAGQIFPLICLMRRHPQGWPR